jgi:hypothetical protein
MVEQPLTAVVCRNHGQFRDWCIDNGRNPRDPSLRPVLEEHHARGHVFDEVILIDGPASLMAVAEARLRRKTGA